MWNLDQELGDDLEPIVRSFYDKLFVDIMVGFFFQPHDKDHLIESQISWLRSNLGDRSGSYSGPSIRAAHEKLPILVGHFDRRHELLKQTLEEFDIPDQVRDEWLSLDQKLRPLVVKMGASARDEILAED